MEDDSVSLVGYADDTSLLISFDGVIDWTLIERKLKMISIWSQHNGLLLNSVKSNYIIFSNNYNGERLPIRLHFPECKDSSICDCGSIQNSQNVKYLGLHFDEKMNWRAHVTALLNKLRASATVIARLRRSVARRTITTVYSAICESHLRYCLLVYLSAFQLTITPVEKLQNRIVRTIMRTGMRTEAEAAYDSAGILPLKKLYIDCLLTECLVRKPESTQELITEISKPHSYSTRSVNNLRSPRHRLVRTDRFFLNRYIKIHGIIEQHRSEWWKPKVSQTKKAIKQYVKKTNELVNLIF